MVKFDYCIIGAGMVGISLARELKRRKPDAKIVVIEKENKIGMHGSGRNSGILHAGIYYEPGSLKARICTEGARRLAEWCSDKRLKVNSCGKLITPQTQQLDGQLDILYKRGTLNGARVEMVDEKFFKKKAPDGFTSSGRALWSPDTKVVDPKEVLGSGRESARELGVEFIMNANIQDVSREKQTIRLADGTELSYGFVLNCSGLQADKVCKMFGLGKEFVMMPFKGNYWKIRKEANINIGCNLYPVPDLNVPFLGVHATPNVHGEIFLGPTATPALGRENYEGVDGLELSTISQTMCNILVQMGVNKRFRGYATSQSFQWIKYCFYRAAKQIVPRLKMADLETTSKVGIRPQLYSLKEKRLVDDFVVIRDETSLHVVNAISPAFTASFALAEFIINEYEP